MINVQQNTCFFPHSHNLTKDGGATNCTWSHESSLPPAFAVPVEPTVISQAPSFLHAHAGNRSHTWSQRAIMLRRSVSLISVPIEMTAESFSSSSTSSSRMPEKSFSAACSLVPISLICHQITQLVTLCLFHARASTAAPQHAAVFCPGWRSFFLLVKPRGHDASQKQAQTILMWAFQYAG